MLITSLRIFILACATLCLGALKLHAQVPAAPATFTVTVLDDKQHPLGNVVVELLTTEESLVKTSITNEQGQAVFTIVKPGSFRVLAHMVGYEPQLTAAYSIPATKNLNLYLVASSSALHGVTIQGKKQFIEQGPGKVIANVGNMITATGSSILEVLEKLPGVTVDRNGGLSLQGKSRVLVLIDGKQTYLFGADLSNRLSGMNAAQVSQVELIVNPSARYDATGNAGVINIKTKKNLQEGLHGTVNLALGLGRYARTTNGVALNFKKGKLNSYVDYSMNQNKRFLDIQSLRNYFNPVGNQVAMLSSNDHTVFKNDKDEIKAGTIIEVSDKTILGVAFSGLTQGRKDNADVNVSWLAPTASIDSAFNTHGNFSDRIKNGAINLNLNQKITDAQDLSIDLDLLKYQLSNNQSTTDQSSPQGAYNVSTLGSLPTSIKILSGKADYSLRLSKNMHLDAGAKSAQTSTDNTSTYQYTKGGTWITDSNNSYDYQYKESIVAGYADMTIKGDRFTTQAGLRYEHTRYTSNFVGNSQHNSYFTKNYGDLFPSANITYQADSLNSFTLTAGRRIDRPDFHALNPFLIHINKYQEEQGNANLIPQYSWNVDLSHSWQDRVTTTLSYSQIKNYFSLISLLRTGIIATTRANINKAQIFGLSISTQFLPYKWWSISASAVFNHKNFGGYQNTGYTSNINQLSTSMENQFTISPTLSAELSGYYDTKSRSDLLEIILPNGQVSVGVAQTILKGKGSLKLAAQDIFYTGAIKGITTLQGVTDHFSLYRDSRTITLGLSYRFGKELKPAKRTEGSAADEMHRAGN